MRLRLIAYPHTPYFKDYLLLEKERLFSQRTASAREWKVPRILRLPVLGLTVCE
jgi:hypothetical protein